MNTKRQRFQFLLRTFVAEEGWSMYEGAPALRTPDAVPRTDGAHDGVPCSNTPVGTDSESF